MKNFFLIANIFILSLSLVGVVSHASDSTVPYDMDTTVRVSKDKLEYGEGSLGRAPSSLRVTQPGYGCFSSGCKSTVIQVDVVKPEEPSAEIPAKASDKVP